MTNQHRRITHVGNWIKGRYRFYLLAATLLKDNIAYSVIQTDEMKELDTYIVETEKRYAAKVERIIDNIV